jgi:hypothetical protein
MTFLILYLIFLFISVVLLYGWAMNFFYKMLYKKRKR